jgi:hypothetical protein
LVEGAPGLDVLWLPARVQVLFGKGQLRFVYKYDTALAVVRVAGHDKGEGRVALNAVEIAEGGSHVVGRLTVYEALGHGPQRLEAFAVSVRIQKTVRKETHRPGGFFALNSVNGVD